MSDDVIAALSAVQHALVTGQQLRDARLSAAAIRHRVRTGRLIRMRHDLFAVPGAPSTWLQAVMAAVLSAAPDAVASHTTAAVMWGLPNVERETTEISTSRPRRARPRNVRVHRTVTFLAEDHTVWDAIPVTTVARTLVDLSARLSTLQLGIATDDALRRNLLTLNALRRCVDGLGPAPGRRPSRIHEVLAARLPGYDPGDSDLEIRVLRAIVGAGLPEPVQQHWVRLPSRRCRIDLAYLAPIRLAIEVDGFRPHATRSAFDRDRARANELTVAGWTILRFTSASTDDQIATTTAAALAALGRKRVS